MKILNIIKNIKKWLWFRGLLFEFTKNGVWFRYKNDEVLYRWPWKPGKKYVSLCCEGEFNTLKEMDKFWELFFSYSKSNETSF